MDDRLTGFDAVMANVSTLETILGVSDMNEVCKLDLDVAEIKKLVGDLADIARCGDAERAATTAALCHGIQGECIEIAGGDPVEVEIAAAVAGGMSSRGVGEWDDETIGVRVARAIKAYRREMAKPDEDDPS